MLCTHRFWFLLLFLERIGSKALEFDLFQPIRYAPSHQLLATYVDAYACVSVFVVVPSILDASLHLSAYGGAPAGIYFARQPGLDYTGGRKVAQEFFLFFCFLHHLPSAVLALTSNFCREKGCSHPSLSLDVVVSRVEFVFFTSSRYRYRYEYSLVHTRNMLWE